MKDAFLAYGNAGGSYNSDGQRHSYRVYIVEECDVDKSPLDATNVPKIGAASKDGMWVLSELRYERSRELETTCIVTADYVRDPLSLPLEVSIYTSHKTVAAWRETPDFDDELAGPSSIVAAIPIARPCRAIRR